MKKSLLLALAFIGASSAVIAQEQDSTFVHKDYGDKWGKIYIAGGFVSTDYKLSDKLMASALPAIDNGAFELSVGITRINKRMLSDLEWNTDYYSDKKANGEKVRTVSAGIKWRPQYIFFRQKGIFAAAGFDLSYMYTSANIFTMGNTIDLNDLDPTTHYGHISLYNNNWYLGPSASFGVLQDKENALRVTTGYEWNVARASWHSDYASVTNTVKEGGQGRFYAKLIYNF
jgi:hypothetical protein